MFIARPSGHHPTGLNLRFSSLLFLHDYQRPYVRCSNKLLSIVRKFAANSLALCKHEKWSRRTFRAKILLGRDLHEAISCQKAINFPRVLWCENRQLIWKQTIKFIHFAGTWFASVDDWMELRWWWVVTRGRSSADNGQVCHPNPQIIHRLTEANKSALAVK